MVMREGEWREEEKKKKKRRKGEDEAISYD